MDVLRETLELLHTPRLPGLPPLTGGLVGYMGYDSVRRLERLPELAKDDLQIPELTFLLSLDLAVLDHADGSVWLIANVVNHDNLPSGVEAAYARAVERLDAMTAALNAPVVNTPVVYDPAVAPRFSANRTSEDYRETVLRCIEEIKSGEAFQIVVSQRFEAEVEASALDVYRVLRATNPSPYMYLLRVPGPEGDGRRASAVSTSSAPRRRRW